MSNGVYFETIQQCLPVKTYIMLYFELSLKTTLLLIQIHVADN